MTKHYSNFQFLLVLIILIRINASCAAQQNSIEPIHGESVTDVIPYQEVILEEIENFKIVGVEVFRAFRIGNQKIAAGVYSAAENESWYRDESENDWGDRLFLLNNKDEVLHRTKGVGDLYRFEPHFYKNDSNNRVVIICQLAFEYCFGGEIYVWENGALFHLGNLNVESGDEEQCLVDVVQVQEENGQFKFTFESDKLIIDPGGDTYEIVNDGVEYVLELEQ